MNGFSRCRGELNCPVRKSFNLIEVTREKIGFHCNCDNSLVQPKLLIHLLTHTQFPLPMPFATNGRLVYNPPCWVAS